jgi:hypothetical protein
LTRSVQKGQEIAFDGYQNKRYLPSGNRKICCNFGSPELWKLMPPLRRDSPFDAFEGLGDYFREMIPEIAVAHCDSRYKHKKSGHKENRVRNLVGTHKITFTCKSGCSGDWHHTMSVSSMDQAGKFSGTGYYDKDRGITWTVNGQTTGKTIDFKLVYSGKNKGYTATCTGAMLSDGSLSGTGFSNSGQKYTWSVTAR